MKSFVMFKYIAQVLLVTILLSSCSQDRRGLVVGKVQQVSKLATTEFTIDKLIHGSKTKNIFWFFELNTARFIAYSQAIVKTGINLKKITVDDIYINNKTIQITLPPVEVINFSYPPEKFRMDKELSDPDKFLNRITVTDHEKYFRNAEIDIRNNLEYMGIVETTQNKTVALLTGVLKNLGYEEIHIGFKSDELIVDKINTQGEK